MTVQNIPIIAEPNQSLLVRLDDYRYELRFKEAGGVMVVDVIVDDVPYLTAVRVLAGELIIPYPYLMRGNFLVLTVDDALPDWREFGVSQTLVYISPEEFAAL